MATIDDSDVAVANILIDEDKYEDALELAEKAVKTNPKDATAYLAKGTALFHLERYAEAKAAFLGGEKLEDAKYSNVSFSTWIRKCAAEIALAKETNSSVGSSSANTEADKPAPVPSKPKPRYDWYQTDTHVIVNVMLKNVKEEDCKVDIKDKTLSVTVNLPTEHTLELDLACSVNPEESSTKVLKPKIEIKLKKVDGVRWTKLEGAPETNIKQFTTGSTKADDKPHVPYTSKKNWDKIAAEMEEDKSEGDAALNELFQKIYSDSGEDVKKAMQKSFYESGGTVLSTNWNEVGKDKVEVKPPDGMEFKKWDS